LLRQDELRTKEKGVLEGGERGGQCQLGKGTERVIESSTTPSLEKGGKGESGTLDDFFFEDRGGSSEVFLRSNSKCEGEKDHEGETDVLPAAYL